jgi:hypothetical protein
VVAYKQLFWDGLCRPEQVLSRVCCLIVLSGKEGSEGTALRSKRPRSESENGEEDGPDDSAHVIAARHMRCSRACLIDEGAGIRPFLEPRKRQLASRARRRVRGAATEKGPDLTVSREVVEAFLAASRAGNFEALLALLDPDVVYREDHTASPAGVSRELRGAASVASQLMGRAQGVQPVLVNGSVGVVKAPYGRLLLVAQLTITGGKIARINVIADPARLSQLRLAVLSD